MSRLTQILLLLILVSVLGTGIVLALWDPPAPAVPVERTVPDAAIGK